MKKMEALDLHFYHSDGKSVWSHCLVKTHVVAEDYSFAWNFRMYFRKAHCEENNLHYKSMNDLVENMIQTFPSSDEEQVYILLDICYSSKMLIEAYNAIGFQVIGLNPTPIYPEPKPSLCDWKGKGKYRVNEYEGPILDIENAKVLLP